ncbi:hypothetical protein ACHAQA_005689 [Verticillium albo-atrum]
MAPFTFAASKTALITGGASGIGLAVARKCLDHGMKVLVADKNASQLSTLKRTSSNDVSTFEMDVSHAEDWVKLQNRVNEEFQGRVDLLFLNAGIQPSSSWDNLSSFHTIFEVNFFGVVHGISTFLTAVRSTSGAAIVITGSKQGITNPPGNPAYNASKSAVKSVAEQLSYDLRESDTNVHFLVPGWTFTGLGRTDAEIQDTKPAAAWTSSQVAEYMGDKMAKGEFYILCPDNEVTEEMDRKRILWSSQDMTERRPPLSRWRDEFKEEFGRWKPL